MFYEAALRNIIPTAANVYLTISFVLIKDMNRFCQNQTFCDFFLYKSNLLVFLERFQHCYYIIIIVVVECAANLIT
jgi:hypothetical protein